MERFARRTPEQQGRRVRRDLIKRQGPNLDSLPTIVWYGGGRFVRPQTATLHTVANGEVPDSEWFHNRRPIREALKKAADRNQIAFSKGGE